MLKDNLQQSEILTRFYLQVPNMEIQLFTALRLNLKFSIMWRLMQIWISDKPSVRPDLLTVREKFSHEPGFELCSPAPH